MTSYARLVPCAGRSLLVRSLLWIFAAVPVVLPSRADAQLTRTGAVIMSVESGKCLEVLDGSAGDGAPIVGGVCGRASTRWKLVPSAGGFRIAASDGTGCLSPASGVGGPSAAVLGACTGDARQEWSVEPVGRHVRLRAGGTCLRVAAGSQEAGRGLARSSCVGAGTELWTFGGDFLAPDRPARIVDRARGRCLEPSRAGPTLAACRSGAAQGWTFRRHADGYRIVGARGWRVRPSGQGLAIVDEAGRCVDGAGSGLLRAPCSGAAGQTWQLSTEHDLGSWSEVIDVPLVPVGAAALRDGKVLFWSAYDAYTFGGNRKKTQTAIFDPATNSSVSVEVTNTQHDMFCPGTAMLADGRVLVNGGSSASRTSIYNPATAAWTVGGNMRVSRGYNADVVLDSGAVFTIGGSWSGGQGGKRGEVWTPPGGGWSSRPGIPATPMTAPDPAGVYRGDNHAWLFSTGNGMVFHAGPSVAMNWFDTAGSGSFVSAGVRSTDSYSMCGSAVMYDVGRILKLGGAPAYDGVDAIAKAYVIDIATGVTVAPTGSLGFARTYQNSVVLPDGRVFVAGGQAFGAPFSDARSVLAGEIWSESAGAFTTVASAAVPRNYHSIALLLPDARVLVGGGGLCGATCAANHPDVEFYSPGYLFDPSGAPAARPVITAAPDVAVYNATIPVATSEPVAAFAFIRMASVTHSVNNDQRRIPVAAGDPVEGTYSVSTPADAGVAPPGYYMLFALSPAGVPSVATIIRIGPT